MSLLEDKRYEILLGDCKEKLKEIPDNFVDSIVTDPPYELGFMDKSWDSTGIAYNVELWKECLRVLKPGGYLLSFGGSRTYHRMACAIEDAGFEIRDQIMWVYGSGFPKGLNVGKAIDKKLGNEREVVGSYKTTIPQITPWKDVDRFESQNLQTKGTSEWEGWNTALKPAHEPIVMARKPFKGSVVENVLEWGVGGINVDGCRVGDEVRLQKIKENGFGSNFMDDNWEPSGNEYEKDVIGRWPANIIHDGSDEVLELFPNNSNRYFYCAKTTKKDRNEGCEDLEDKPSGCMVGNNILARPNHKGLNNGKFVSANNHHPTVKPTDLMRKLVNLKNEEFEITEQELKSIFYCAKTTKKDRNEGCEDLEEQDFQIGDERPSGGSYERRNQKKPLPRHNIHPTVKPTDLMCYLERLITQKDKIVLDPFMGSGSTGKAAMYEGFKFIGIEMNEEYVEIAKRRIEFALKNSENKIEEKEGENEEDTV